MDPLWALRGRARLRLSGSEPRVPVSRPLCQPSPSSPRAELCPLPFPFRPKEGSKENGGAGSKRALEEEEGSMDVLSKNKQKKQLRNPHKTFDPSLKRKLLLLWGHGRGPPPCGS